MRRALVVFASSLLLALLGCPGEGSDPTPGESGTALVVGLSASPQAIPVERVRVVAKVDGAVKTDTEVKLAMGATVLSKEVPLEGRAGAPVDLEVTAWLAGNPTPAVRRAALTKIPSAKKLLRVALDPRCIEAAADAGVFGAGAPACNADQTCIGGMCASKTVADGDLEPYDAGWAEAPPDFCRPANHGAPEVAIGQGQTDYGTLAEGATMQLEKGPQGGHHLWIAARMRNLRQSGTTAMISSKIVGETDAVPPAAFVFTFDRDEGGYCKLYGLRYQLDVGASDLTKAYKRFLGKTMEITIQLTDSTKATATSTRTVKIADKILCPDGTTACNTP